ncbi:zinc-binding protein A33-like [Hemitrygon akajei]|uniref:zinc-binding protein A33-like n=1 Tax=Hemitrygon akajei TaxID=2704970 RepID=UPI003BF94F87
MASKGQVESWTEEAICAICLDFFTDPVSLACGHNFCRSCITRFWESEERNSCPECREVFADRTLRASRALANLSEKARKLNLNLKEKECKFHCEEHEEELKLFCETDRKLICLICRDALEHKFHSFMPANEAVKIYKDRVKSSLDSLTKKKSDFQEMELQQKEKISGVREQSQSVQSHITSQFDELRRIITEKEQQALQDLREEEEMIINLMEKNLREIQENLNSIQEEISKLQTRMDQKDNVIFLMEEAHQKRSVSDYTETLCATDGTLLAEKFDHPYLLDIASEEVLDSIKRVSVTLDVETAHPRLKVSEDLKSVKRTGTQRNLPDTGKRFTDRPCVLGSEGFISGRHYWEVEVTGNRRWCLGVAAESVERKRGVRPSPETGFWIIGRRDNEMRVFTSPGSHLRAPESMESPFISHEPHYGMPWVFGSPEYYLPAPTIIRLGMPPELCDGGMWGFTSPESRLPAGPIPGRVGVYLSYESGTVSFYNAETKSHLHTFTGNKFTEKLYPFFWSWNVNEWLRICSGSAPDL